jgi:single-strand selective monofunctional uracil DNA glycosylase
MSVADRLVRATLALRADVKDLSFGAPVTHVYDPLQYAWPAHREYLRRFGNSKKRILLLGMNPGPFGMAQTGVPFGEIAHVRDWLGIEGRIGQPAIAHPKRPIEGFACKRVEVSGTRLWGAIAAHWKRPERFFADHFIANYCPLVFMEESGRNRTPDKLPADERDPLYAACDRHLRRIVRLLEPDWLIGIGAFAEKRARSALHGSTRIATVLHPSPANPRANRDWEGEVRRQLDALGLCSGGDRPRRGGRASNARP